MTRRGTKQYRFNDLAGCVSQRVSRATKTLVGVYHSGQAGLEEDPTCKWSSVCEVHHTLVCHSSLYSAQITASDPTNFCDECREATKEKTP